MRKSPRASLSAVRALFVESSVSVIVAPVSGFCQESVTVPPTDPRTDCARL
jgi:hypothetical protein